MESEDASGAECPRRKGRLGLLLLAGAGSLRKGRRRAVKMQRTQPGGDFEGE
jgi:MYXO-CTERM domain-containing protein